MKLTTHTTGHGTKTVAIVPGISAEAAIMADLSDRLAAEHDYTVIGVDLRGHGESPRAADYALSAFSDDLVETLPTGLDLIIGHSLGGRVLLDSVSRLLPKRAIYLDPAFAIEGTPDPSDRTNVGEHRGGSPFTLDELKAANPGWGEANWARAQHAHDNWDGSMYEQLIRDVGAAPHPNEPPVVPSLVLKAENSPLVGAATAANLARLGWEVRTQAGAGHNLHLDDVDATLRCLDGWI